MLQLDASAAAPCPRLPSGLWVGTPSPGVPTRTLDTHTRTHTHTHSCTRPCTHAYARTHSTLARYSHTHAHPLSSTPSRPHAHARTRTHSTLAPTHARPSTHAHTLMQIYSRTHARTHTHTHTHTHTDTPTHPHTRTNTVGPAVPQDRAGKGPLGGEPGVHLRKVQDIGRRDMYVLTGRLCMGVILWLSPLSFPSLPTGARAVLIMSLLPLPHLSLLTNICLFPLSSPLCACDAPPFPLLLSLIFIY